MTALKVREAIANIGAVEDESALLCFARITKTGTCEHFTLAEVGDREVAPDLYLSSGLYPPGVIDRFSGRTGANVKRIMWLPFDFDLSDWLGSSKLDVHALSDAAIEKYIVGLRADVEAVFETLNLPIHRLDYTGYGLAAYVYLPFHEQEAVAPIQALHKRIVERINVMARGRLADPAVSDAGPRIMRVVPCLNTKGPIPRQTRTLVYQPNATAHQAQLEYAAGPAVSRQGRVIPKTGETFDAGTVGQIVDAVRPHWVMGARHRLALALAAMMAKAFVPEEQAAAIVEALSDGDGEQYDRLRAVHTTYDRLRSDFAVSGYFAALDQLPAPLVTWLDATLEKVRLATAPRLTFTRPDGSAYEGSKGQTKAKAKPAETNASNDALGFEPAPIPESCYRGWVGAYVDLVTPLTEAPPIYHFGAGLALVAATMGRSVFHDYAGNLFCADYFLLIGMAGKSRKDTAIKIAVSLPKRRPAHETRIFEPPFTVQSNVASGQGLIKALSEHPDMLLYVSEYQRLIRNSRAETSTILQTLTEAWDAGDVLQNTTKGDPLTAKLPCLTVLAAVQPGILAAETRQEDVESGYLTRFLPLPGIAKGSIPNPPRIDTARAFGLYQQLLRNRTSYLQHAGGTELLLTADAEERWAEWYEADWNRPVANEDEGSMQARLGTHARKMAMIFAASEGASELTLDHINAGIDFVEWSWKHTKLLMKSWGADRLHKLASRIERALERHGPMTKRRLQQTAQNKDSISDFKATLQNMAYTGAIVIDPLGNVALPEGDD
jgi:hypothetical protein